MSQEGRFFTTLSSYGKTFIPGGAEVDGELKVVQNDHIMEFFDRAPIVQGKVLADGSTRAHSAPTGATGDENLMMLNGGTFEYHILGTQTILAPVLGTGGLDVGMDQTANDGVEICCGINAVNKGVFTVGTSPAFFARLKFSIADVSGTDDCAFGFRKVEAYQANIDDYDEMAVLNVISGAINIETILNAGDTTTTDTTDTWADGATHELKVKVSAAGVVTYEIDGRAPTTTAAFTFDTGEVVVPFFYFLNDTDLAGAVILKEFECGYQD